jgi:predicted flap endonuclease-1-like 5' DNA nuclease
MRLGCCSSLKFAAAMFVGTSTNGICSPSATVASACDCLLSRCSPLALPRHRRCVQSAAVEDGAQPTCKSADRKTGKSDGSDAVEAAVAQTRQHARAMVQAVAKTSRLVTVPGLGRKYAEKLRDVGITTVDELHAALFQQCAEPLDTLRVRLASGDVAASCV